MDPEDFFIGLIVSIYGAGMLCLGYWLGVS